MRKTTISEKFSKYVIKKEDEECWDWSGRLNIDGYAIFKVYVDKKIKWLRGHRVSWEIFKGEIPNGFLVLHKCDNRKCTNPNHLFLGNNKDNVDDMVNKDRGFFKKGYSLRAKLSDEQVLDILNSNEKQVVLKKKYGVCRETIRLIKRRKTWGRILNVSV